MALTFWAKGIEAIAFRMLGDQPSLWSFDPGGGGVAARDDCRARVDEGRGGLSGSIVPTGRYSGLAKDSFLTHGSTPDHARYRPNRRARGCVHNERTAADSSDNVYNALTSHATKTTNRFGTPQMAYCFNGSSATLVIPDHDDFSVNTTGYMSISVWVRPEGTSLNTENELLYAATQGAGYVHWFGNGDTSGDHGNHEWTFRIYSADNTETPNRHNRMSFYHFGYDGGRGPGCYVQDPVVHGVWIHFVAIIKPELRIWWYKNGDLRDTDGSGPADSYRYPMRIYAMETRP